MILGCTVRAKTAAVGANRIDGLHRQRERAWCLPRRRPAVTSATSATSTSRATAAAAPTTTLIRCCATAEADHVVIDRWARKLGSVAV